MYGQPREFKGDIGASADADSDSSGVAQDKDEDAGDDDVKNEKQHEQASSEDSIFDNIALYNDDDQSERENPV